MTKHILTKDKFRKWLESKSGRAIVGYRAQGMSCPIANCLHATTDIRWKVWPSYSYRQDDNSGHETAFPNAEWMSEFISRVDSGERSTGITAAKALEILEQI